MFAALRHCSQFLVITDLLTFVLFQSPLLGKLGSNPGSTSCWLQLVLTCRFVKFPVCAWYTPRLSSKQRHRNHCSSFSTVQNRAASELVRARPATGLYSLLVLIDKSIWKICLWFEILFKSFKIINHKMRKRTKFINLAPTSIMVPKW